MSETAIFASTADGKEQRWGGRFLHFFDKNDAVSVSYCAAQREAARSVWYFPFSAPGRGQLQRNDNQLLPAEGIASEKDICVFSLVCGTAGSGHSNA